MKLQQYPAAIAQMETQELDLQDKLTRTRETLALMKAEIEHAIAFDPELKNEAQRKAKKAREMDILADTDYSRAAMKVRQVERALAEHQIALNQCRSEFAIAKLRSREKIARMEMAAA